MTAGSSRRAGRRFAFLGPEGTFTEAALLAHLTATGEQPAALLAAATVQAALEAVRAGEADAALVPLENSVEGSVAATVDALATGSPLAVQAEVVRPIRFALLARPGTTLVDVQRPGATLASHPHGEAQCRRWLAAHLPDVQWVPAASNADAARQVAAGTYEAALAGAFAGERYELVVVADDVQDVDTAQTRFVLVGPPGPPPAMTGADKTSLVLAMGADHPGALLEILTEFAVRGINLTRIESRPTGDGIGDYSFSIDAEGHVDEARVREALVGLHRICADVRFLGSYPRADGVAPTLRHGVSDGEYAEARAWLDAVREGRA